MNPSSFGQLLACRRMREDRAIELLAARLNAKRQAEVQAAAAHDAVEEHARMRAEREAALLEELQGRKVSLVELERYKARLAELASASDRLRGQESLAEAEIRRCDGQVTEARAILQRHRREHEKWRELTEANDRDVARRQDILTEIEAESGWSDRAGARRATNGAF